MREKKIRTCFQITITNRLAAELIKQAAKDEVRSPASVIARAILEKYGKEKLKD